MGTATFVVERAAAPYRTPTKDALHM